MTDYVKCTEHGRYNCPASQCQRRASVNDAPVRNAGTVSVTNDGYSIGVGGGVGIDPTDGSVTVQIAPGVAYDTGGSNY